MSATAARLVQERCNYGAALRESTGTAVGVGPQSQPLLYAGRQRIHGLAVTVISDEATAPCAVTALTIV